MHLLSINELFIHRAVTALCWTLFHSLWQGLIAALLAAFILIWTRWSRPAFRYKLLSTLFFVSALLFAATFLYELFYSGAGTGGAPANGREIAMVVQQTDHPAGVRSGRELWLIHAIGGFLSQNSSLIVAGWFIILSVRMARMFFVLGYTRHIVRHKSQEPPLCWKNRITLLCHRLRIAKPVTLLESKIAKLPVVFGQLKPFILVPLGLLTELAPDQVEAILLHELAHIRRNDYLVNVLQNIIETLFFFNPALLWMSSLIRDERENCCDDIAIQHLQNKKQYVESLICFRERSTYSSSLSAVGFVGRRNSFLKRISRIVENKNYTLSRFEKGSLACSTVVAASLAFVVALPNGTGLIKEAKAYDTVSKREDPLVNLARMHEVIAVPGHGYFIQSGGHPPMPKQPFRADVQLQSLVADVIDGLIAEGIVKDKTDPISFLLTNRKLVVNGQQQPERIHERLKTKYISANRYTPWNPGMADDPDFGLHYISISGSLGLGIHH